MNSTAVIEAFLDGSRDAYGDRFHIEGDALVLDGWWHIAFRVAPDTFFLRDEPAPDGSDIVRDVADALSRRGFGEIPGEHPLIVALIYTELSTAGGSWKLWSTESQTGKESLARRVGAESEIRDWSAADQAPVEGLAVQLESARRTAGLPPVVVVAVGLDPDAVRSLEATIPQCRFEARGLDDIAPAACGDLGPSLILVDARERVGREFIMELRAAACGRFLPVAAVTRGEVPAGADVALDPDVAPGAWRDDLIRLLPA